MNEVEVFNAACRQHFYMFAVRAFREVEPGVTFETNWHIHCIAEHLQALFDGKLPEGKKRLCINIPPRSLKSYLGSIAFPAWVMGRLPHEKFINTSYNFPLAKEMAQNSRILMQSDWYKGLFPNTRIDDNQNEKHNFWTTQRGMYYSSAIQSVTGKGSSYVTLDDPINPKESFSETIRTETNSTIRSTLPTRFNDMRNAKWLMIMQRLHEDDPTGHFALLHPEQWHTLILPAENLTQQDITYTLGAHTWTMKPGELLFPVRLTREVLDQLKEDMGVYNYAGQMLQSPVPVGGGEFKDHWINYYGTITPKKMNIYILVDPSGGDELNKKKRKTSDFTAMLVIGLGPDKNYYLLDAVRDRLNPTERVELLFMLHQKWNELGGKPPKVGYEKYGMMADTHYIRERMKQDSYNFPLVELGGTMDKMDRIRRIIPDMQNGLWYYPPQLPYVDSEGRTIDLVREIIHSEMKTFPKSRFDDMIDAKSRIKDMDAVFPAAGLSMASKARRKPEESDWRAF